MKVVSSVPDVGKRSTAAILAEIGDVIWLSNGKQIASWTGLAPSLYQSGGVCVLGSITKQGSKCLRGNMVEVAHAAVKVRDSKLGRCFCVLWLRRVRKRLMSLSLERCLWLFGICL